jgi:hypothetical protein
VRRGLVNLCLVLLCCATGAAPASAAVSVSLGGTLEITGTAAPESVTLTAAGDTVTVASPQGVEGACGAGLEVVCAVDPNATVRAELGAGADAFDAASLARPVLVRALDGGDTVRTGAGGDSIVLEGDGNDVDAGAGGDTIAATGTVRGGPGDDWLSGDGAVDGGPGDDTLEGIVSATLIGGDGRDTARFALDGPTQISLDGVANDGALLFMSDVRADVEVLRGGAFDDVLIGTDGTQELDGGPGADRLDGGDGADTLLGGDGADTLLGGAGADALHGGDGADALTGDGGADVLDGGDGADTLTGGADADVLRGADGDDELDSRDGAVDEGDCGDGDDRARADAGDRLAACEHVEVDADPTPTPEPDPTPDPTPTPDPPAGAAPAVTAAAPAPAADPPPSVRVSIATRIARGRFARRGVVARVRCSESCTVSAVLRVDARTAKRLDLPRRLARATGTLASAGSVRVRVKPTASVRRRLTRVRRTVKATLRTTAIDGSGQARVVTLRLRLSP